MLPIRLVYGLFPDVVNNPGNEKEILFNIINEYLYRNILERQNIRKPAVIQKLLQTLASKVGNIISFNELGDLLEIDTATAQRYIDLFEKANIIFHLPSYSRNVSNELKRSIKIYFYDNGVRNALISNFALAELRTDIDVLWENFLISERLKNNAFNNIMAKYYFWRTAQKQEIDFLEEKDGKLSAWEFKYNEKKANSRCPLTFAHNYPGTSFKVITPKNYMDFVSGEEK